MRWVWRLGHFRLRRGSLVRAGVVGVADDYAGQEAKQRGNEPEGEFEHDEYDSGITPGVTRAPVRLS